MHRFTIPILALLLAAAPAAAQAPTGVGAGVPAPASATLTLEQAEARALSNNPQINASAYSAEAAGQQVGATSSSLYPTLDAAVNYNHSADIGSAGGETVVNNPGAGLNIPIVVQGRDGSTSIRDTVSTSLTARQTLLDFTRKHDIEAARQGERAALFTLDQTRQDVLLQVRQRYFDVYIDQVILDIRQETVDNRRARLEQAQGLYQAGSRARIDVASAESDLAQAQLALLRAQTQLDVDWIRFNVAMGAPEDTRYQLVLDEARERVPELDPDRLLETALAYRPELRNLEARLKAQLERLDAVYAGRLPTVGANASLGGSGQPTPLDGSWSAGLSLNWNIFDGMLSRYQAGEARATARSLAEQLEQQRLSVYQEVATQTVAVRQAAAQRDAAEVALASARESYRLASERYRVGVGSAIEVSDAELQLATAQSEVANASHALRNARAQLERAVGVRSIADLPEPAPQVVAPEIPGTRTP